MNITVGWWWGCHSLGVEMITKFYFCLHGSGMEITMGWWRVCHCFGVELIIRTLVVIGLGIEMTVGRSWVPYGFWCGHDSDNHSFQMALAWN